MIILDIETAGLDPHRHSMVSLGAVDFNSGLEFYGECHAYVNREIEFAALAINGFSYDDIMRTDKPSPHQLYLNFINWVKTNNLQPLLGGHNLGSFDVQFLLDLHEKYGSLYPELYGKWIFGHRFVDLHSVAFAKFGKSMKMDEILKTLGLPEEPKPHNALNGARCERAAFLALKDMGFFNHE